MTESAHKAVFLSYASQDAEAARRICESLRSAGVEVWFDADGGLEHGDEWDAKIRRQIKECVLFIPIISANTQARHEGYFRLEWELAAERAMTIASGVAFILPVVIDDTREPDALVPDRFRKVQWTRLRQAFGGQARPGAAGFGGQARPGAAAFGGQALEIPPDVVARFVKLWSHRTATLAPAGLTAAQSAGPSPVIDAGSRRFRRPAIVGGIVALLIVASSIGWSLLRSKAAGDAVNAGKATTSANVTEVDRLMAQALAFFDHTNYTRADIATADVLARKATDLAPDSAEAWATRAYVQAAAVWRLGDCSDKRLQDLETFATRALAIDPKQVRAMIALGELYRTQQAWAQAEAIARRGIELQPESPHLYRILTGALEKQGRLAEAMTLRRECVRKFPRDPFTHHGYGIRLMAAGDFAGALHSFDQALAVENFTSALLDKAILLVAWKGDLTGARAVMEQVPLRDRTEVRVISVAIWLGLLERRLDQVQAAAGLTAETYLTDAALAEHGPKALPLALAYHIAGKPALAQQQWQAAEAVARARQREYPSDDCAPIHLAITLAWLGRTDEATREVAASEAAVREQAGGSGRVANAVLVARYYAARGEAASAVSLLRLANTSVETSPNVLSLEPWWDKIREAPEFQALLAEAKARRETGGKSTASADATPAPAPDLPAAGSAKADPKSVVVLPFANLSDDKEQEYFSDGLTEEILNALARERDLRVVPRTSAFSFKLKNLPLPEIARALNVAQVVEGSVQRAGSIVRIRSTLTRVTDGFADPLPSVEGNLADPAAIFALQEKVARLVVEKLTRRTTIAAPVAVLTRAPEAYDAYLRGRALMAQTSPSWLAALEPLQRAVDQDPQFALAWANLGRLGAILYVNGYEPSGLSIAGKAIERALQLQPDLAEGHFARAVLLQAEGAPIEQIEREVANAEKTRPNDPELRVARSLFASARGDRDASLALLEQAVRLDPRNGQHINYLGLAYLSRERFAEAESTFVRAFEILGSSIPAMNRGRTYFQWTGDGDRMLRTIDEIPAAIRDEAYWEVRAMTHYWVGDYAGALEANAREPAVRAFKIRVFRAAEIREAMGDLTGARREYEAAAPIAEQLCEQYPKSRTPQAVLALTYAGLGRKEEALAVARKAVDAMGSIGTNGDHHLNNQAVLAQVLARFGQMDEALEIMKALAAKHSVTRHHLLRSPDWRHLRKDPRFQAIAEKAPL